MPATEKLGEQFKAVVADGGELERTFSTATHHRGVVDVGDVKEGDLWRHTWQHEYPYQRATGPSFEDPDRPDNFLIPMKRTFSPHQPGGTKVRVIRERKQPVS